MVGEFKDDCVQNHQHHLTLNGGDELGGVGAANFGSNLGRYTPSSGSYSSFVDLSMSTGRYKNVTHGKQKGVKFIIKVL